MPRSKKRYQSNKTNNARKKRYRINDPVTRRKASVIREITLSSDEDMSTDSSKSYEDEDISTYSCDVSPSHTHVTLSSDEESYEDISCDEQLSVEEDMCTYSSDVSPNHRHVTLSFDEESSVDESHNSVQVPSLISTVNRKKSLDEALEILTKRTLIDKDNNTHKAKQSVCVM